MMCTPDGSGCALTALGGGSTGSLEAGRAFASVADALRVGRALGTYLNSPAAADLDGAARGEALEQLGAITSLLAAATNGILRRFDAADDHDADSGEEPPRQQRRQGRGRRPRSSRSTGRTAAPHTSAEDAKVISGDENFTEST